MTEYNLEKENDRLDRPYYCIEVKTKDLGFLNFLDEKLDELISLNFTLQNIHYKQRKVLQQ